MVVGPEDDDIRKAVAKAFTIGAERTFDQDPRFGLCVLAEIAVREMAAKITARISGETKHRERGTS